MYKQLRVHSKYEYFGKRFENQKLRLSKSLENVRNLMTSWHDYQYNRVILHRRTLVLYADIFVLMMAINYKLCFPAKCQTMLFAMKRQTTK